MINFFIKFLLQASHFLSIVTIIIIMFLISLIIFYNEYFKSKYLEEQEKLNFKNEVYQIAKKLINCLGEEKEGIFYVSKEKLDEYSKKYVEIEPRCAIAENFDYNVKIIQFEREIRNYPIQIGGGCGWAWVINSGAGEGHSSVSLVTSSGYELRRHYTSPDKAGNPSRTAVDTEGNIWIGNRGNGLLVKIAFDKNECIGKTSEDVNEDGKIDINEIVSFNEDGCIIKKINLPDCYFGGIGIRAVCIDKDDSIYVGCWDGKKLYKISKEGEIENVWNLSTSPYGCVVGNDNNVYITTISDGKIIKLNPKTNKIKIFDIGKHTYGIWRCYNLDCIAFSTWGHGEIILFNTTSEKVVWEGNCGSGTRGVFIDKENNVYVVASNSNIVCKFDKNGKKIKTAETCGLPTGISMDVCGDLWVECMDGGIKIFDTNLNLINSFSIFGKHYVYSDFTGFLSEARVEVAKIEKREIKIKQEKWEFSLLKNEIEGMFSSIGPKIYYETSISLPILIKYNETFLADGLLIINAYKGFLETFYSFIDDLCNKDLKEFEVSRKFYFDYDVKVYKDKICSENVCKKLICNYEIEEKEFKKGENVIRMKISNNKLEFI